MKSTEKASFSDVTFGFINFPAHVTFWQDKFSSSCPFLEPLLPKNDRARRRFSSIFRYRLKSIPGVREILNFIFWQLSTILRYLQGKKKLEKRSRKICVWQITLFGRFMASKKSVKKGVFERYFYDVAKRCLTSFRICVNCWVKISI